MRMPLDISATARKTPSGQIVEEPTTAEQRARLRKMYEKAPRVRVVEERFPEPAQEPTAQKPASAGKNSGTDWIDRIEEISALTGDD